MASGPWRTQPNQLSRPLTGLDPDPAGSANRQGSGNGSVQIFASGIHADSDGQTLSEALAGLRHPDRLQRREAAHLLGDLNDIRAVPDLLRILSDEEWIVRLAALWALGQIAPKVSDLGVMREMTGPLNDDQWLVRRVAAWANGRLGDDQALSYLLPVSDDAYSPVREAAIWALGRIGVVDSLPRLALAINDPGQEVALRAVEAIGAVKSADGVRSLVGALRDDRPSIRYAAARALGKLGDMRAFSALLSMLHVDDPGMRMATAEGLASLAEHADNTATRASAYQALQDLWSDPASDPVVRGAIGEAMARIHEARKAK